MVETQQGISTFLSFGAKSVKPEILEELLIGRQDDINYLSKCVGEIAEDGINHQIIVVGQRGMGKTHLLRVLYQRSQAFLKDEKLKIAYFSEEEYGISGYLDFLIRVLNAFIRWNDDDREELNKQMDVLRETHPNHQIDAAENIITSYIENKPLLILAENFDDIMQALGKDGQGKLRSFLYRHNRTSIIATSQALSPDLGKEDRPFYNFFTTIYLKKLSYEDSLALLRRLAEMEKQENVIEHLKGKGIAQVRAVHELVKGNHRLLVTFYEFLKADTLATLSKIFIKTLNDLKPYYETFIRYLPPQQQKILHYIALAKMPQNGTEIGKNCFIEQKTLSKQLSELSRRNLIDAITDPDDKRNKLYDIAEPLLRISIEIGEHREGISALFIDFLALYYSFDELATQKNRFENLWEYETNPQVKEDLWHDVKAREKAIDLKKKLVASKKWSRNFLKMKESFINNEYLKVIELSVGVNEDEKDENYYCDLGTSFYIELKEYLLAKEAFQMAIKINPNSYRGWYDLGCSFSALKDYENAIDAYKKAIAIDPNTTEIWANLGRAYIGMKEYSKAIDIYLKIVNINPEKHDIWNDLGAAYQNLNQYSDAIEAYEKAIKIRPDYYWAWSNLGIIYNKSKEYLKAIRACQKAIEIKPNKHEAWYNLGVVYNDLNEHSKAIEYYREAIRLKPNMWEAWDNLGNTFARKHNYKETKNAYVKSIETGSFFIKNESWLSKEYVLSVISKRIIFILQHDQNLTIEQVKHLENIIEKEYEMPKELEIPYLYLKTFRRYVLKKEEKALLELPKEQRAFFVREILEKRKIFAQN